MPRASAAACRESPKPHDVQLFPVNSSWAHAARFGHISVRVSMVALTNPAVN